MESQGGNIPVIHISAKFNKNIDLLEELILFETELMELKEVILYWQIRLPTCNNKRIRTDKLKEWFLNQEELATMKQNPAP